MPFVNASIYRKAKSLAISEGLPKHLLSGHDELQEIREDHKYVPIHLLFDIYELAEAHLAPGFGLRQGKQFTSEDYGTLGLSWRTCWKASEVLYRTQRFMVLVTDYGSISVDEKDGITETILERDALRVGVRTANEATFVMLTVVLEEITGRKIKPVKIQFKHQSKGKDAFESFLGCPVLFGQELNSIEFYSADLEVPTLKADQSIHQFFVDRMDEELEGIQKNADQFLGKISKIIEEALPSGIPGVGQVAEHLGMSTRTLKRRLSEKGLTFRDLVQQIQKEMSTLLLKSSQQSMAEIAFQTGFSEQSAFNRAFKRWMGQSPVDYRKFA